MIRNISELNDLSIVSFSDAHSSNFHRIGREATVIKIKELDYYSIIKAIHSNSIEKTYEFKPSEGKYFWDGHRAERHLNKKGFSCHPKEKINICPICGNKITKGVLSRIYELKDQKPLLQINMQYIVPLLHLISVVCGGTEYTKKNLAIYHKIVRSNNGEFNIWNGHNNSKDIPHKVKCVIDRIKTGKYSFVPGYDSVYGKLELKKFKELMSF